MGFSLPEVRYVGSDAEFYIHFLGYLLDLGKANFGRGDCCNFDFEFLFGLVYELYYCLVAVLYLRSANFIIDFGVLGI